MKKELKVIVINPLTEEQERKSIEEIEKKLNEGGESIWVKEN